MKKTILGKSTTLFHLRKGYYLVIFLLLSIGIQAQDTELPGKIRVKFTSEVAAMFETSHAQKSASGNIIAGTASLKKLHNQFEAKDYKRVYPHGGKFETKHRKHGLHLWYDIDIDMSQNVKKACETYMTNTSVISAEPILIKTKVGFIQNDDNPLPQQQVLDSGTNDPLFPNQWHYNNTGQVIEIGVGSDISLLKAWEIETGNPDVIVSVHDGGIKTDHEDLIDNLWINADEIPGNGIDDDNNGYIDDIHGYSFADETGTISQDNHGTHVSGIIGATTNNNIGVSGIAGGNGSGNGVRLMSCAVFGEGIQGGFAQSYIYAADNGAVISQNSWESNIAEAFSQSTLDAIRYFIAEAGYDELGNPVGPMQGGIVIVAAGNANHNLNRYPAAFEEVIAVGATTSNDDKAPFSNWGDWVDIAAPGSSVLSTIAYRDERENKYSVQSGTSMACPHVSGVAALIVSRFAGNITPTEVRNRLLGSTDELPYNILGSGRLNAFASLQDNDNIRPEPITDFTITNSEQNTVSFSWTSSSDQENGAVYNYEIRYSTSPITENNYDEATVITQNILASTPGNIETFTSVFDISTTYYIAIKAMDHFGNFSNISNVVSTTTGTSPLIALSPETINFNIDISTGESSKTETITVNNIGDDVLNYKTSVYAGFMNQLYLNSLASTTDNLKKQAVSNTSLLQNNVIIQDSIYYDDGNEDEAIFTGVANSSKAYAVKFDVDKPSFTLTHVRNYMDLENVNAEFLPITIEIRKGPSIKNSELLLSQQVMPDENERKGFLTVPLMESLYFTQGDVFWIVHKYQRIYNFPQGIEDPAIFPAKPNTYFYSINAGGTYISDNTNTYITRAISGISEDNIVVLSPEKGDINPNNLAEVLATCDASNTPNGEYTFSLIIDSNDPQQNSVRVPCQVSVTGQIPEMLISTQLLEFNITILELELEKEISIKNNGLGDLTINFTSDNQNFEVIETITIPVGEERAAPIKFIPLESGFTSGIITLTTNDPNTPEFKLQVVGAATDPPVIKVDPSFIESTLDSGQVTTEKITISNTGNYPLTFSFPELATTKIDDLQNNDTDFEYSWMDSNEIGGPVYVWNDIKKSGTEINIGDIKHTAIDLPFIFNFYGEEKQKVQVHSDGMLYFSESDEPVLPRAIGNIPLDRDRLSDFIAVFYHNSEIAPVGNIYYKLTDNALIVQYEQVGRFIEEGTGTFQVVLLKSGNILFYYKDMVGLSGLPEREANIIGIENSSGTDGLPIYSTSDDFTVEDNLAVMIRPKKGNFITNVTSDTGVIPANSSMDIDVTIDTGNLINGVYQNDILISSNDPNAFSLWVPFTLNVNGLQEQVTATPDVLAFEETFVGVENTVDFSIKNPGSANITIENITSDNDQFIVGIETPFELKPFEELKVPIIFTPTIATTAEAIITITTNIPNSDSLVIPITGTSLNGPVVNLGSLISFNKEAYSGEKVSDLLTIKNEGESRLQYSVKTPLWSYIDDGTDSSSSNGSDQHGYRWKDNKSDASNVLFDYIDIAQTGIDITDDITNTFPGTGSSKVDIGFDFKFYENVYTDVWISSRGLLYFGDNQISASDTESNRGIPSTDQVNNIIASAWDTLGINGNTYYQLFNDHFVVQYTNKMFSDQGFDLESQFSMQVILYANGNIKLQYKDIANEEYPSSYTIGIENETGDDGMLIAFRELYIRNGLAVLIKAPEERFIDPGETTILPLVFDATNLNKGEYTEAINVLSNDPSNNNLTIPVNFTVFGDAAIEVNPTEVDFGEIILIPGNLEPILETININNIGSDTLVIDAISTDNDKFTVSLNESISIAPSESAMIDITSSADSFGEYFGNLLITSNDKINGDLAIPLRAKIVDSPMFLATTKNDTIYAKVKLNGLANENIKLTNNATLGTLSYDSTLDYLQIDAEFLNNRRLKSNVVLNQAQYTITDSLHYSSPSDIILDNNTFGFGNENLITATKFIVGSNENFELTHIRNYYDPGTSKDPITIKVYKGGTTPNEGQLLLTQQHEPQSSAGFELITLDNSQNIKAEETFWIIIEYPLSMLSPQGVIFNNVDYNYQTFYYSLDKGSSWSPMDHYFINQTFQIRALGSKSIDWIELSPDQGDVLAGTNSDVNVQLNAAGLNSGTYYANINFNSNDPLNVASSIPVRMTVNALPEFYEAPTDTLQVIENETIEIDLRAIDNDGELVFYTLDENYDNVSFESLGDTAKISFTPDFTQSGLYTFTVKAFDDLEDYATTSFTVQVIDNNRPPVLIKQIPLQFYIRNSKTIDLSDYIEDPDNDTLSYIVTAIDPNIIELALDGDLLKGEPLQWGNTNVSIVASDGKGGQVGASYRAFTVPSRNRSSVSTASKDLIESTTTPNIKVFNEPNPFQYETTIKYTVEKAGHVRLEVFSFDSKLVETLINQTQEAGDHEVLFDRKAISSGTYIYTIQVDNQIISKKMIIQ